jgi:small subunit ribosomal protein S24e
MMRELSSTNQRIIDLGEGLSIEVVRERLNKLVGRKEYTVVVHHEGRGTPSIPETRVKFSEKMGFDPSRVYIRYIRTGYGVGRSEALIHVYDSSEKAKAFEPKYVIERNKTLEEEIKEAE